MKRREDFGDWAPDPHVWRRFKLAETNMLIATRRHRGNKRFIRARKWAREMNRWTERILE